MCVISAETFSQNTHLLCHQKVHTEEEPWESQDGDCPAESQLTCLLSVINHTQVKPTIVMNVWPEF